MDDKDEWIEKLEATVLEQGLRLKEMETTHIEIPDDVQLLIGLEDDQLDALVPFFKATASAKNYSPANKREKYEYMADIIGDLLAFSIVFAAVNKETGQIIPSTKDFLRYAIVEMKASMKERTE